MANPKEASASAAVSVSGSSTPRRSRPPDDLSQPSVVVQGAAARDSRPGAPRSDPANPPGSDAGGQSGPGRILPPEVAAAPAAVQAAAMRVTEGQGQGSVDAPGLEDPPGEESSGAHMVALKNGTTINGRYRVERMLGRGGMGTVYLVRHTNTEEKLALKLLHPALAENEAAVERFRTEARAPVRIGSDHVVRVVDADVCDDLGQVPFMVMERLKGHDLRSELKRRGALPAGEVVLYLSQVARALDKAHAQGIIHRDLKPANMYVVRREDGSPLVKVLDFGIAKLTDDAAKELTMAGQVFGTPWYMAPEQARGELGAVGPGTDLWALGLIAFQLLTGMNYWTADGMAALVGQICYEPMPPPTQRAPHLGPLFDMWFGRACNRDPSQRFSTARELVTELAQALGVNQSHGISTGSGENRHFDSSLQIGVTGPHGQQPLGQSGSNPGMSVAIGQPAGAAGATPVPGTALTRDPQGAIVDGTNPAFYTTQQPFGRRRSSTTAVLLGVVIAFVMAASAVGIWLLVPPPTVPSEATEEGPASGERGGPPAPAGTEEGDSGEDVEGAPAEGETASDDAEPTASGEADETDEDDEDAEDEPVAESDETKGDDGTTKPPINNQPPPPSTYRPPPGPKPVAPKVGDVTF